MPHDRIGRYEIRSELGRGGMSTVFHAYDPRFKRDIAIKVLPREFLHDPLFRTRFEREAETIAALEHPAIVPVYDFGEDDGQLFLVMRYMAGGSLADRLERGPYPLPDVVAVMARLAPALDKAHGMGVVHRDIKPGNILFDEDNNAFLTDFGIAKLAESSSALTGTGSMVGTPAYMSPEQARGDASMDGRSDVYSLGVILFEMLTGDLPFHSDTPMGVAVKHITDPVPRILHLKPDLPPRCEAVVVRAMSKDVDARYQSAGEMVRDLRAAIFSDVANLDTMSGVAVQDVVRSTKELPAVKLPSRGVPIWVWAIVGVVLLSTAALLTFTGGNPLALFAPEPTATFVPIAAQTSSPTPQPATGTPRPTPTITPTSGPALGGRSGIIALVFGPDNNGNIYLMDTSCINRPELCGSGLLALTTDGADNRGPAWSPDGTRIAYRSSLGGNRNIYVMDADGKNMVQLTTNETDDYSPAWSPDGAKIVFVSERDGNPELYVMNADGSNQTRLTNNEYPDYSPAWSPDGQWILFYSRRDFNTDIFLLNANCISDPQTCSAGQVRLTTDPELDYEPVWSPDGGKIAFVSERDGNPEIYMMNSDGSNQTRLTANESADQSPAFSPDGTLIAFISHRDGNWEIYVMNANGSFERRMTNTPDNEYDPVWKP